MSGDVQPRKRKDKKRKKDDEDWSPTASGMRGISLDHVDNVMIHIHKEAATGGHWFSRIVFFGLLAILFGVVGLIIVEHRGTIDVNTPVTASQWETIFDGWVDDASALHKEEVELKQVITPYKHKHQSKYGDDVEDDLQEDEKKDENLRNKEEEKIREELESMDDNEDINECYERVEIIEKEVALFQDHTFSEEEVDEGFGSDKSDESENAETREHDNNNRNEEDSKGDTNGTETGEESNDSMERQFNYVSTEKGA